MLRRLHWVLIAAGTMWGSVVIDRIAVIVATHAVKTSDIDRDLRATQFLNGERPDFSTDARRKAAERLIDQTLIRDQIERGGYARPGAADVERMLTRLRQERFGGAGPRMQAELSRYGLTEEQLRTQLQWQSEVLQYIEQRYRPGVLVTEEEVKSYYDAHLADLKRQFPQVKTYEGMALKIRASLEGERLNQNFEQGLSAARKRTRIVYRQGAFQ